MKHAFPCGCLPLDLVGTLRARRNERPRECLETPADLDDWLDQSGLLPGSHTATPAVLADALILREAIYALVWARLHGEALPEESVALLNLHASAPVLAAELLATPSDTGVTDAAGVAGAADVTGAAASSTSPSANDVGWRPRGMAAEALGNIARQAVAIIGGPDTTLLRECARPECTQVYLDHSRGHRREWCSMKTCGSRVKAAAYRARKRDETLA
ncbi:CGNR zinc finger domain-containing protein [Mycetocola saprophilus]|uniref:CGNR zinc finger domain-containing protein n=1 Tax=Mycetocola saprophilus TaxID=76636 RepID=UPI0004C26F2D|nr:ABATE domain-containing protein [Mycetocola saprophilus]